MEKTNDKKMVIFKIYLNNMWQSWDMDEKDLDCLLDQINYNIIEGGKDKGKP